MPDAKTCRRCGETKPLTDFYRQPSNRDGRNTMCKRCFLTRNEPIQSGTIKCSDCERELEFHHFTVQRTSRHGRSARCKECVTRRYVQRRHTVGPVVAPSSGKRALGMTYLKRDCLVCGVEFEPLKKSQTWCRSCGDIKRDVQSHMGTTRGRHGRQKVSVATSHAVAVRHIAATACAYCGRAFNEGLAKSIDHIHPFCRGGNMDDPANIEICCIQCNRSKASMTLDEWLQVCTLVAARIGARAQASLHWVEGDV